jgi:hypothetical protein
MLDGLDDIDWATHEGAYGPCIEAPDILRDIASPDAETAADGRYEFASSIWHQGTVYPVTVAVLPFVVELATTAGVHKRDHLLRMLGGLCDAEESDGAELPAVRAGIAVHAEVLLRQVEDPDPVVREAAAYAVAHCAPRVGAALERRWAVETDPRVRASLLMGIVRLEPVASADLLRSAALAEAFPVPVAAALAYARAGLRFPAETIAPIAAAFGGEREWSGPWSYRGPLPEVLALVDHATADALTAAMTVATVGPEARKRSARALIDSFQVSRSAPVRAMPLLRELLTDTDLEVVLSATRAAASAGTAAAAVAGELARLAGGGLTDRRFSPAQISLATLVRLGDPRWREPLMAAWADGVDPSAVALLRGHDLAFNPELFAAARTRLRGQRAAGVIGNEVIHLVALCAGWGPAAGAAVPELLASFRAAPWAVSSALAELGPTVPEVAPALRQAFDEIQPGHVWWPNAHADRVRAGHAWWRVTGDPEPLVAAGAAYLKATGGPARLWELNLIADAGPAAAPLLPTLRPALTGRAARIFPEREAQIGAARVVWLATGEAAAVLPTVEAVLLAGDVPVRAATELAAELASPALVPALRATLDDRWGRIEAARALWRHGIDPAELLGPLEIGVRDPYAGLGAVSLLVEMGATAAVPGLRRLAEQDERVYRSGEELVWHDDLLRRRLHEAVSTLSGP